MRFLLFIPALVLFLSNIPFIMEMKGSMEEMSVATMAGTDHCSMKDEEGHGSCGMKKSSASHCAKEEKRESKDCQQGLNGICLCTCCFQYTGQPTPQLFPGLGLAATNNERNAYMPSYWQSPYIARPAQPPEMI